MKFIKLPLCISLIILAATANMAQASKSSDALSSCKDHVAGSFQDVSHTKIRKIRSRNKFVEIKMSVTTGEGKFNAVCKVTNKGELTFTKQ
ncbi:MAG: hypothetical protein KUG79_03845 [Pseudomonadales bacterium]|nr:hypothetical protein [Pseudomonadales bacterium]